MRWRAHVAAGTWNKCKDCLFCATPSSTPAALPCRGWCAGAHHALPFSVKCGWPLCAGCDVCATTKICMPWCEKYKKPWGHKCKWKKCSGCGTCSLVATEAAMTSVAAEAEEEEEAEEKSLL